MANEAIEERRGDPALAGTRISVYDVFLDLLDSGLTEGSIADRLSLTVEQVAAARGYILNNPDTILARHHQTEARSDEALNPPEVVEKARKTRELILGFKEWLKKYEANTTDEQPGPYGPARPFPSFREWLAGRESRPTNGL